MNEPNARQPLGAAVAAFLGITIEWYDYFCNATAAALVFGEEFFATGDKFTGLPKLLHCSLRTGVDWKC